MKKWMIGISILVFACVATTIVEGNQKVQAEKLPKPYITFDGTNVTFAEGMPDCH